jgi:signal transduction histidine kinase
MLNFFRRYIQAILVILWLVTTLTLVGWWFYFAMLSFSHKISMQLAEEQRMLIGEAACFMLLLLAGAFAMAYYISLEKCRSRKIKQFFAVFSHDLKTSLASLRLQAEILSEDLEDRKTVDPKLVQRLTADTVRLELQLENSLFLSQLEQLKLFEEALDLKNSLDRFQYRWPNIQLRLTGNAKIMGDARALDSVFANVIQNAVVHGHATEIEIQVENIGNGKIALNIEDNGKGFLGNPKYLASLFERSLPSSGSGIGLFISMFLIRRMGGTLDFPVVPNSGFKIRLTIKGKIQ